MNEPPRRILESYCLEGARLRPLGSGLINETWLVETLQGERLIMQRVNRMFPIGINEDIEVVTRHLASKGLVTQRLVPTRDGAWCERHEGVWRVITYVHGVTRETVQTPNQAYEAGALLARFHRAVEDLDHDFKNARLGVHDTARHLAALRTALHKHMDHPHYALVSERAEDVLVLAGRLADLPDLADRVVHGDPKISNVVFDESTDQAICLIDLDTVARMPVVLELGDAMRSWCNPSAEDAADSTFSLVIFRAAMNGYAREAGGFLVEAEWRAIVEATLTITVELAARFCADALDERYFGWDRKHYASASEHNQARTVSQLALARSILAQHASMTDIVQAAFGAVTHAPLS